MIKRLNELDLKGKRVFIRVDFNVPIHQGKISETHRIESALPTLRFVIGRARTAVIASHLGRPGGKRDSASSLAPVRDFLEQSLASPVTLSPDCVGSEVEAMIRDPQRKIILLENLRFHKEEEKNDPAFARALAVLAEVYVNDAFGAAHRAHASTVGMAAHFQAKGAGLLMQKELDYLGKLLACPDRPFVAVLGGAKVSDKIGVIRNLLPKLDSLLIGGAMAYTFLKAQGISIGRSLVEEGRIELARELLDQAKAAGVALLLPTDHIAAGESRKNPMETGIAIPEGLAGLDIGPKTRSRFTQEIRQAKLALWNGPVGLFEDERFRGGTLDVAHALADSGAVVVVAGGDTVAAVMQAGVQDRFTHLSTGGGATLEFLEGRTLPGVAALEVDT